LCKKGDKPAGTRAEEIAAASYRWWNGSNPNFGPQFDTIFFRYIAILTKRDHNKTYWKWASAAAQDAKNNAHDKQHPTLYLRFWDGSSVTAPQHLVLGMHYGQIQTHSAPVALFAWLSAFPLP